MKIEEVYLVTLQIAQVGSRADEAFSGSRVGGGSGDDDDDDNIN